MARQVRDTNLDSRNARRRLKVQPKPYWRSLDKGLHLGYRKHSNGGSWTVRRLNENGSYEEKRLGTSDDFQDADGIEVLNFSQAQEASRKWSVEEIRKEHGLDPANKGVFTVAQAMSDYMSHYSIEGKAVKETQISINAHILPTLGKIEVSRLTTKTIIDWHRGLATKPITLRTRIKAEKPNLKTIDANDNEAVRRRRASANRVLTRLKAALNYAWNNSKVANDSAWRKVKPFKNVDAPVIRYLTEEECVRLVNTCPPDLRQIVQGALYTGCRYGELTRLKVSDYNPDAGRVMIRESKSGKPRHAILTEEGQEFFNSVIVSKKSQDLIFVHNDGAMWGKSHQSRPLLEACKRVKIEPEISFHVLRHTHGSLLAMKGVPLPVIAQQLGHSDTRMTEKHYAHLSPSYVADTIRQNFPKLGLIEKNIIKKIKSSQ